VDERVGDELANGGLRKHGDRPAQRLPDDLVRRQQAVDEADEALEARRIALRPILLPKGVDTTRALMLDDANRLAPEASKVGEALGEQERAQIQDVPTAGRAARDKAIIHECGEDAAAILGQWSLQKVEVRRVVKLAQHIFIAHMLCRDALLERSMLEHAPERPFLLRMFLQLLLV